MTAGLLPPANALTFSYRAQLLCGIRFPIPRTWTQCPTSHKKFLCLSSSAEANEMPLKELNKIKTCLEKPMQRFWETSPQSLKIFPWKKAEGILLDRLLILGRRTLKWTVISYFIVSSVLDIAFSISTNRVLMIPLGLFIGCTLADFLNETSLELFKNRKDMSLLRCLIGLGSFFMMLKLVALGLTVQGRTFVSNLGTGGLTQVLWLGRRYFVGNDNKLRNETSPE